VPGVLERLAFPGVVGARGEGACLWGGGGGGGGGGVGQIEGQDPKRIPAKLKYAVIWKKYGDSYLHYHMRDGRVGNKDKSCGRLPSG